MTISSAADAVRSLWPLGSNLLDIGCGSGAFVRTLLDHGYDAGGCDPQAERIAEARAKTMGAAFEVAGAEALPYGDATFDGCVMVHSLHHVPQALMRDALAEAMRCTKQGGFAVIVEPLPEGSFFDVLRLVDDETEVRNQAQACLNDAMSSGRWHHHASQRWTRRQIFKDDEAFIAFIAAADPERRAMIARIRNDLARQFNLSGLPVDGGLAFDQPIRCEIFGR